MKFLEEFLKNKGKGAVVLTDENLVTIAPFLFSEFCRIIN